jgi:hydrogenase maturation protease
MTAASTARKVLVIGVGNTLLQDDGIGVRVTEALRAGGEDGFEIVDGGTVGLALLPALEDAEAAIVVDASELGAEPGAMRIFYGEAIDRQLSGKRRTVHEVALADLFSAASLRDRCPARRALVAIQPGCTEWGLDPTEAVAAAIPEACRAIRALALRWGKEALHAA